MAQVRKKEDSILFYYNPVKNEGDVSFVELILVLNDKHVGKLLPEQYLAVAEKSKRVEELNNFILDKAISDIENNPDKIFIINLSPRMLQLTKLNKILKIIEQREQNIIFAFDKIRLNEAGEKAKNGIAVLRERGVKIMIDGIEYSSLRGLMETDADYIRLDGRFYDDRVEKTSLLKLLIGYSNERGQQIVIKNVDTLQKQTIFSELGIKYTEGKAVCTPKRSINRLYDKKTSEITG